MMYRSGDPYNARLVNILNADGYGTGIAEHQKETAVKKYLCNCHKKKQRREQLMCCCMDIVTLELERLQWNDKCFEDWVKRMVQGADVSQLEYFYSRYRISRNKNVFFLGFVINEL